MNDNVVGLLIAGAIVSAAFGALLVCLMVFWDGFRLASLDEGEDDTRRRRSTLRRGHGAAATAFVLTGVFVTAAGAGLSLREPADGEPRPGGGDGALLRRLIARAALLADRVDAFVRETPLRGAEEDFMVSERRVQARGRGAVAVTGVPAPSEAPPAAMPSPDLAAAAPPTAVDGRAAIGAVPRAPAPIERVPPTQPIRVRRSGPTDTVDRRAASVVAPAPRVESGVEAPRPVVSAPPPSVAHRPEPAKVEIPGPAASVAAPADVWAPTGARDLEPHGREIKRESVAPEPTDVPRAEPPEGDRGERNERSERRLPTEREQRHGIDKSGREKTERSGKVDRSDKADRPQKAERADKERLEKLDRREKVERPDKLERREKVERPEKIERRERVERPERVEKIEKVERPERVEKIEKVERPERRERIEKVERPEGRRR